MGGDVVEVDWGIHRGSESGTCLHSDRSCRLAPAHEGMENETWSLEVFGCGWCHPSPLDSGLRRNDEMGGRNDELMSRMTNERLLERSIPNRSPGHVFIAIGHAGWRRHTKVGKLGALVGGRVRCRLGPRPTPSWGQAPALHFSCDPGLSLFGRRWLVSPAGAGNDPGSQSGTRGRDRSCSFSGQRH